MRAQVFLLLGLMLWLHGCGSSYQAPVDQLGQPRFIDTGRMHRVNDGETLYVIAWMYDLDFAALARVNNLREPYNISPGQMLSVDVRSQSSPSAPQNTSLAATSRNNTAPANTAVTAVNPVQIGTVRRAPLPSSGTARPNRSPLPGNGGSATAPPPISSSTDPVPPPPTGLGAPNPATPPTSPPATATMPAAPPAVSTAPPATTTLPPAAATLPAVTAPLPSAPDLPDPPPVSPASAAVSWAWPHAGSIVGRFSDSSSDNKGIDISGNEGDAVLAAADGEVVYAGSGLLHYGNLIILKHNDRFLSAYAHNRALVVREKERVTRGQKIAELGSSGIDKNMLHFEIRVDGTPTDPLQYLPPR